MAPSQVRNNNNRHGINLLSALVTVGVLFVAVKVSDGSFATHINKISQNLDKALSEVIDGQLPTYTEISDNETYVSSQDFNPRGMAGLYNLTRSFMDLVLAKADPAAFLKNQNNEIVLRDVQQEWQTLVQQYAGLLALIIILLLIIILMPISGFFFCCCRCCGKCGARSQPVDKKHDLCMKIVMATFLIGLGTLLLFGVVCSFASTQQMKDGAVELPDNLRGNIRDVNTYLENTKKQVDTLLNQNYKEFHERLTDTISNSSNIVYDNLAQYSQAVKLTDLSTLVRNLSKIEEDFITLKYSTNALRIWAPQLNDAVRKIKKDLLSTLSSEACEKLEACKNIKDNISTLNTNIHFENLPDMSNSIEELSKLVTNNISYIEAVEQGEKHLNEIKSNIEKKVNETMLDAKVKIAEAGNAIAKGNSDIQSLIDNFKGQINEHTKPAIDRVEEYVKNHYDYVYYTGIAISCILLAVAVCIAFGLICGICGKRPDGYGDDCCNKGSGSSFLICGVMVIFLSSAIFGILVLAASILGILSERVVCDSLRNPNESDVFQFLDTFNMSQTLGVDFTISEVLISCRKNNSIYNVFKLEKQFNLDDVQNYTQQFQIDDILNKLDISDQISKDFKLMDDDSIAAIHELGQSSFVDDVNLYEFEEQLNTSFTTANFSDLSERLNYVIQNLTTKPNAEDLVTKLSLSKITIDAYQERLIEPMVKNATNVLVIVNNTKAILMGGEKTFKSRIQQILREIKFAEMSIKNDGSTILQGTAKNFTGGILKLVDSYLGRVVNNTRTEVGRCGPLSLVINSALTSTCDKVLLPLNGFWFGLFWCLILFIPIIFVSVKLSTLYQKLSPYSGPLAEAEYLCDAFSERDTFPLNSRGNNKVKKKGKKYKRYEDRALPSTGGDRVASEYHHQDQRYTDMAPKHWEEFPAGGPPQYQRAPTEYERPPPYYYPGASENQP